MMHIVLLAGGKSRRLWPFSDEAHAKQFIKLLDDDRGGKESMVQRMHRQIQAEFPDTDVLIATNSKQEQQIIAQLGTKVFIVCEPQRRDTFAAIALSTAFLYTNKGLKEDEVVVVLPADGYVEQSYFSTVQRMVDLAASKVANVILMGIQPKAPSSHFGYIVPTSFQDGWSVIERFVEKPTVEIAQELIEKGARWNGGVFVFTVGFLRGIVEALKQEFSFTSLYNSYATLPKKSFDYVVVEKESSLAMVEYDGLWKDLGTWEAISSVLKDHGFGQYVHNLGAESATSRDNLNLSVETKNPITTANSKRMPVTDRQAKGTLKTLPEIPTDGIEVFIVGAGQTTTITTKISHKILIVPLAGSGYINEIPLEIGMPIKLAPQTEYTLRAENALHLAEIAIPNIT